MTTGKIKLELEIQELRQDIAEVKAGLEAIETSATEAGKAQKKLTDQKEKDAKAMISFLDKNLKGTKKLRQEEVKAQKEMSKFLNKNIALEKKRRTESEKSLKSQIKFMTRLGQLSMATYAIGRLKGYLTSMADMVRNQEAMAVQAQILETKGKGWADALKEAQRQTRGLVKMHELLASANMAESMGLGIDPKDFATLAIQARRIALKLNEPFEIAFNKLMKGIARGSRKLLDDLIPGIRGLEAINQSYARTHGITTRELTEQEKILARKEEVLHQIRNITEDVTDEIVNQNTRLTQQLNKLDIWWNKQKKGATEYLTQMAEFLNLISTVEEQNEIDSARAFKKKLDALEKGFEVAEGERASLIDYNDNLAYSAEIWDELVLAQKDSLTATQKWQVFMEAGQGNTEATSDAIYSRLSAEKQELITLQLQQKLYNEQVDDLEYMIDLNGDLLSAQEQLNKELGHTALMYAKIGDGIRGATSAEENNPTMFKPRTFNPCPEGYERSPVTNRCIRKRKGRKTKTQTPDFDAYAKEYMFKYHRFEMDKDNITQKANARQGLYYLEALASLGKANAKEVELKTKTLKKLNEITRASEAKDREDQLRAIEIDEEIAERKAKVKKEYLERWLDEKKLLDDRQANLTVEADREILAKELTALYDRRIRTIQMLKGTAEEIENIELAKTIALAQLRVEDTIAEKNYLAEKIAIQENALGHMESLSQKFGDVALQGLMRGPQSARAREELEMQMANINATTEEGLAKRQKLEDDYNARKAYEDEVWLDRAVGNALISAGSEIYSDGITNVWKGGGMLFDPLKSKAGLARMAYGGAEILAGGALGYSGEAMLPPTYQGPAEGDEARDANDLNRFDDNQEIVTYNYPSQRNFINATTGAVSEGFR